MITAIAIGTWRAPSRRALRRNLVALGVVLGAHAAALLALVAGAHWTPDLVDPPTIEIELVEAPTAPAPEKASASRPAPARAPRLLEQAPRPAPIAAPPAPMAKPAGPPAIVAPPGFTARKLVEQSDETRKSLRDSLGCRHEKVAAMTRDERAACAEADGKRALTAPMYAAIDPDKKAAFDGDCKKDDEWCLYRTGKGPYPGIFALGKKKKRKGWDD